MLNSKFIVLLVLLAAVPAFAAKNVTVEQLNHEIASLNKEKDAKVAEHLYDLQLTQRLSSKKLAAFEAALPGPKSRRALVALADQAEFLDPPPEEIPDKPAPSVAQQRAIIAKSISYAEATLQRLPNLFASRNTIHYEDSPPAMRATGDTQSGNLSPYQPLHPVGQSTVTVLYRKGKEIVQKKAEKQSGSATLTGGLITYGEFGPILSVLYGDLPKGNLRWGHWERGKTGLVAVFRFDVHKADSHYLVRYCCISGQVFKEFPAYHGEITINPSKGTILRVTLVAEMPKHNPMTKAEFMLEYGPVELGGKKYICPKKSISVSRAPMQGRERVGGGVYFNGKVTANIMGRVGGSQVGGAMQTMLNQTTFDHYHLFRGEVKILSKGSSEAGSTGNAPADASHTPPHQPR